MRNRYGIIAMVALTALAGCTDGSDGTEPSDPSEAPTTEVAPEASSDTSADDADATASPTNVGLTMSSGAPPGASVSVSSDSITDDRVVRRGGQSEIRQGQVFSVDDARTLDSVSFEVVAANTVGAGELIALDLYEVENATTAVPSGFVDIGSGDEPLVRPLGDDLVAGAPTYLTFSFPAVELETGLQYAAVLSLNDGATETVLYVQHAASDVYAGGLAIRFEGATWKVDRAVGDQAFALTFTS